MHPIERLRYVARAEGAAPALLVRESALALADVVRIEPVGLVPACRRLIDRHLTTGPMWWLAARMLTASDPAEEAWRAAQEIEDDPTARVLADALADDAVVLIVGWPDLVVHGLRSRGDVEALVAEGGGYGASLVRRLTDAGNDASLVPDQGIAAAAMVCGVVVVEALAAGPDGVIATAGSHAAAAVAAQAGIPVWAVTGVGRVLPERLWEVLLSRLDGQGSEPWDRPASVVPASLFSAVVGPSGLTDPVAALSDAACPVAPELLRDAR